MSNNLDPEQERLIRLREMQLSTRDPGIKKKKFTNVLSEKERRTKNSLSIGRVWYGAPFCISGAARFMDLCLG